MDILNTKTVLALGLSGAMSAGTAQANLANKAAQPEAPIVSVSSPDLRVTVYDGIATLIGTADSAEEAEAAEKEILEMPEIDFVINLITAS